MTKGKEYYMETYGCEYGLDCPKCGHEKWNGESCKPCKLTWKQMRNMLEKKRDEEDRASLIKLIMQHFPRRKDLTAVEIFKAGWLAAKRSGDLCDWSKMK